MTQAEKQREEYLEYRKKWYQKNKEKQREYNNRYWNKKAKELKGQ